jgi:hypothetical protein
MNKSIYYLEILVDNLSICLDSDIYYYHHFKLGDIIVAHYGRNELHFLINGSKTDRHIFTLNWDNISENITLADAIRKGIILDRTKSIERENKLNQLGIV